MDDTRPQTETLKSPFEVEARRFIASRQAKNTRDAYARDLSEWLEHCSELGLDPTAPSPEGTIAFRDKLVGKQQSAASIGRKLSALSAMYRYASEQREPVVRWNPFSKRLLPRPPVPRIGKTEPVDEVVAEKMIEISEASKNNNGLRDAAVIAILYSTGLRRVSVAMMRRNSVVRRFVERDGERVQVLVARTVIKGGEEVEVEIPEPYSKIVDRWLFASAFKKSAFVFPGRYPKRSIGLNTINDIINARAAQAGVDKDKMSVHPHCFRVSFVTGLYDAGVHERDIQASVHHKDPRSTQRYDRGRRGTGATVTLVQHRKKEQK